MPKDGISQLTGFSNDSSSNYVTQALADVYFDTGKAAATQRLADVRTNHGCLFTPPATDACFATFIKEFGASAFRRAVEPSEADRYRAFFRAQETTYGGEVAVRMVMEAVLSSPHFLYLSELGNANSGSVALTPDELATQLSYALTDGPPDADVLAAKARGDFATPALVSQLARAVLAKPRAKQKMETFFRQYLHLEELALRLTGPDAALGPSMVGEALAFSNRIVWEKGGTFQDLLSTPRTFVDASLAPLYGKSASGTGFTEVALDPTQRAGLFTQLGFLSARLGPIHRGRLIKEGFLCGFIPDPPPGASAQTDTLKGPDPNATEQERWVNFQQVTACAGCHSTFQPLGIAFDSFDELGRFRTQNAAGRQIDPSGQIVGAGDADGAFANAVELSQRVAASKTGQDCFVTRYLSFTTGRNWNTPENSCAVQQVAGRFATVGHRVTDLGALYTENDSFYRRTIVP